MGAGTYAHAGSVYQSSAYKSALALLEQDSGGVRVSAHVPAVSNNNKQNAIVRLGMRRDMVQPVWGAVTITVTVERRPYALVPDLCWELDRKLPWCVFGETAIPADSYPLGVLSESSAQHVAGAVIISVDPNQAQGDYSSTSFEPDVSDVRLLLTQGITSDFSDMELLIARRNDLLDVLGPLNGALTGASPPVPEPHVFKGRPWGRAWSKSWGPNFE